jgi:hypothetical protein
MDKPRQCVHWCQQPLDGALPRQSRCNLKQGPGSVRRSAGQRSAFALLRHPGAGVLYRHTLHTRYWLRRRPLPFMNKNIVHSHWPPPKADVAPLFHAPAVYQSWLPAWVCSVDPYQPREKSYLEESTSLINILQFPAEICTVVSRRHPRRGVRQQRTQTCSWTLG